MKTLKTGLTGKVIHQASLSQLATPNVYCGVGTKPRAKNIKVCREEGIGILSVSDGVVTEILKPQGRLTQIIKYQGFNLRRLEPNGTGGYPQRKGIGPAKNVAQRVRKYLETNPQCGWREIYENVPNHYISPWSMCNAMKRCRIYHRGIKTKKKPI